MLGELGRGVCPMLFDLYIPELIDMLNEEERIDVYINEDAPNIIVC